MAPILLDFERVLSVRPPHQMICSGAPNKKTHIRAIKRRRICNETKAE